MEPLKKEIKNRFYGTADLHSVNPPDIHLNKTNRVVSGSAWMLLTTLALFFLPLVNGLVGGFIGGYRVGSLKKALAAAVLPAAASALGLWALFALLGSPVFGIAAGSTIGLIIALSEAGVFVGAAVGGYAAEKASS